MNNIVSKNALINGYRIAYGVEGDGEPIVLIHGTPSSSYIWRNVTPHLLKAGYKVHLFDMLGYGLSERPASEQADPSMTGNVGILNELLDLWGLSKFHLVAHDIGGGVAQRFGVEQIERLQSLTMIDVVSYDSYPSKRTRQQMEEGLDKLIRKPHDAHVAHFTEWLLSTHSNPSNFDPEALQAYLGYISGPIGQASLFQHQVAHYDPKHTMEVAERLHVLGEVPVQLIWGADDAWQVVAWAHKLQAAIPGSRLDIIPDCGHFAPEEKPNEVAAVLLNFLSTL